MNKIGYVLTTIASSALVLGVFIWRSFSRKKQAKKNESDKVTIPVRIWVDWKHKSY